MNWKSSWLAAGTGVLALLVASPLAASASAPPTTHSSVAIGVDATSTSFGGWRTLVGPGAATQTAITVAATGSCIGLNVSVGVGAEQNGSGGLLGARVYSQCVSGTQVIAGVFETTGGPVPMATIGALAPGDVVSIAISTTASTTTVTANGPLGSDSLSAPDVVSAGYRVGIWPLFATHVNAKMPNFGVFSIYKNVVNSVPMGTISPTKVRLIYGSPVLRAKTGPWNAYGDIFKMKWLAP